MSLKRSLLTLGLITAAGVVLYVTQPETTPLLTAQEPHHGCHFEPKDAFLYAIKQSGSTDQNQRALSNQAGFEGEGSSITNAMTLSGTMLWELHQSTDEFFRFHATLKDFEFNQSAQENTPKIESQKAMLARPFAFSLDARCRFLAFGFEPDVSREVQEMVRGILQNLEFVTAPSADVTEWRTKQSHALGQYIGVYATTDDHHTLERTKELAPSAREKDALRKLSLSPKLTITTMKVTRDLTGKWATQIDGEESLTLTMGTNVMAKMDYTFSLSRERHFKHTKTLKFNPGLQWLAANQAPNTAQQADAWKSISAKIPKMPVEKLLNQAKALIQQKDFNAVWQYLALYYRAHPEVIATLMAEIKAGRLEDTLESWVIMALGKAGIPEANAALRALVDDDTYPHRSRYRGVVAHLNVEDIDNDNLESLLALSNDWSTLADGKPKVLSGAARHMIGNQLAVMNKQSDRRAEKVAASLQGWLDEAQPGFDQRVSLKSVGNSGDTRFFEQMRDISQKGDARTREVGYHAMRFMDSAESHAFFLESIQNETDPEAFDELSETVAGQNFAEQRDALIRNVGQRLLVEPNADIRVYLIDILASVIEEAPEAKAYLTERVKTEKVIKVIKRIGEVMALANNAN